MKKSNYKFLFFLVLFTLMFFSVNAQNTNEDTYIINEYFQLNKGASLLLENKIPLSSNVRSYDNIVLLNQTGNNNQILVRTGPEDSQIVSQNGKNNYYEFITYYNKSPLNFNILQKGNSNSLHIYGENSLIKNMSIIQKSNNKTITIASF